MLFDILNLLHAGPSIALAAVPMAQVFKRKYNALARVSLLAIVLSVAGIGVFWDALIRSPWETQVGVPQTQPIPFSHQHHVSGLGLDCRYCHGSVTSSAFAGLPPTHTCMTCHSQIWQDAPMLKPVRDSFAQNLPIEWNRVYRLPKYVYFDHSIHVNKGVGCTSCHGPVESMPITWKNKPFYMKDCLACHRAPEKYLRPLGQVFDARWDPPANQLERGARLAREYHIPKQRLTDCYTCHR